MYIDRIRIDWNKVSPDSYLTRIPAIGLLQELAFRKPVTFFVGENGTGKSTLLEAIAIAYGFNPEGGTLNYSFSTHDDYSELCDALTIAQGAAKGRRGGFFLRAESFYNVSTKAIEYEKELGRPMYGDRTLHEQSHGESFLSFIRTFTRTGLFIMDEPEAALSPQRQLSLFSRISIRAHFRIKGTILEEINTAMTRLRNIQRQTSPALQAVQGMMSWLRATGLFVVVMTVGS